MAEDEGIFDPMLKKKKKKKKTPFDLDAAQGEGEESSQTQNEAPAPTENGEKEKSVDKAVDDIIMDDDFSSMSKKKKRRKKPFDLADLDEALPKTEEKPEPVEDKTEDFGGGDFGDEDMDFSLPSKKKKKKKVQIFEDGGKEDDIGEEQTSNRPKSKGVAWEDSDRDYTYDELLKRVFDIMREKNPDMVAGEKKRFVMKPPQVMRVGTKKSSFSNFAEICKMLHRQPKHLLAFLLAELGTSGSVDGNNQLIIKGRFQQKQIEAVLRRYIKEYVTCHTCRSPDTILQKDTRLFFLQCETCGSRCSVASIKSGFQAVTGKRAAIRAKTT
jgi:translation initiation factor 2 subunit 2